MSCLWKNFSNTTAENHTKRHALKCGNLPPLWADNALYGRITMKIGDKVKFICDFPHPKMKQGHKYSGTVVRVLGHKAAIKTIYGSVVVYKADIEVKPVVEPPTIKAPPAPDYKFFADTCFETAVRWRDGWKSVISGKQFQPRDYSGLHGGHYHSRAKWGTRHFPMNCHAITQGENFAMSRGCVKTISAYTDVLHKKYSDWALNKMLELAETPQKLTIPYLQNDCMFCFEYLQRFCPNGDGLTELAHRIKNWDKKNKQRIVNVCAYLKLGQIKI